MSFYFPCIYFAICCIFVKVDIVVANSGDAQGSTHCAREVLVLATPLLLRNEGVICIYFDSWDACWFLVKRELGKSRVDLLELQLESLFSVFLHFLSTNSRYLSLSLSFFLSFVLLLLLYLCMHVRAYRRIRNVLSSFAKHILRLSQVLQSLPINFCTFS